ncbi:MAG: hypothetical protein IT210_18920 [Armatimonadetes bacterium]|nr:hypothetical protein [Armatimonadota bacterium]
MPAGRVGTGAGPNNGNGGSNLWSLALGDPDQCAAPGGTITCHGALTHLAGVDLFGVATVFISKSVPPFLSPVDLLSIHADLMTALGPSGKLSSSGYTGILFSVK